MKRRSLITPLLLLFLALLSACGGVLEVERESTAEPEVTLAADTATEAATTSTATPAAATATPAPTEAASATATPAAGDMARFVDETAGVALRYPAGWSLLDVDPATKEESTVYAVSFFSWEPETAGQGGIPEGGTKFDLVVMTGTPATSLEEAITARRAQMAEMEPPEEILDEERVRLDSGLEAVRWLVESRGEQALVYLTYVDGRVIMISGLGDFALVDAIARTLEPLAAASTPAALTVAYVQDGNAWLWDEESGGRQVTENGGVENVFLSGDGQRIAFVRGGNLWAVNSDGSDERQLTTDADFAGIDFGELADLVIGVAPYQVAWLPGTHTLLFNTTPQLEGPGLLLSDDLWRVDADSGELSNLLPRGEGGSFVLSPGGTRLALVRPGTIDVVEADGSDRRQLLTYEPVLTYSEYQYYAQPVWSSAASTLLVAIPPADPLSQPLQATTLWRLHADGTRAEPLGNFPVAIAHTYGAITIAPDLSRVAFLQTSATQGSGFDLMLAAVGEMLGDPASYSSNVGAVDNWSPGGTYFVYAPVLGDVPARQLGQPGEAPQAIGAAEKAVFDVTWVDDNRFLYVQESDRGWDLVLGQVGGPQQLVASAGGPAPPYDIAG